MIILIMILVAIIVVQRIQLWNMRRAFERVLRDNQAFSAYMDRILRNNT